MKQFHLHPLLLFVIFDALFSRTKFYVIAILNWILYALPLVLIDFLHRAIEIDLENIGTICIFLIFDAYTRGRKHVPENANFPRSKNFPSKFFNTMLMQTNQ